MTNRRRRGDQHVALIRERGASLPSGFPFKFIPWILGQFETVAQVRDALSDVRIVDIAFSEAFPHSPLHWIISDRGESESESISQFFHILGSVEQQRGCVRLGDKYEITIYSSCCNTHTGVYYYRTYENSRITGVDMHKEDLDGSDPAAYPLVKGQQILMQN